MPDENRVFDVTKPKYVSPSPTSKPVIVGHHPMISDPMVKNSEDIDSGAKGYNIEPTRIQVNDEPADDNKSNENFLHDSKDGQSIFVPESDEQETEHMLSKKEPDTDSPPIMPEDDSRPDNIDFGQPAPHASNYHEEPKPDKHLPEPAYHHPAPAKIEGLHLNQPAPKRKWPKFAALLFVLAVGAFMAVDSGIVGGAAKLPFHIFKQDEDKSAVTKTPAAQQPAKQTGPVIPAGFKEYRISGTTVTFAAPIAWGDPTSTTESGYSKRGGTNQADGTYAYLVNFATNKNIQIAVTSGKYLPPVRAAQYYDYLQWCTGTVDSKYYQSVLKFTTVDKVDMPSTTACDQGPLTGAIKMDEQSLVWSKVADAQNKVIGDIYIRNLNDVSLVALRVKDAVMTNGDSIKQLLSTAKTTTAAQ